MSGLGAARPAGGARPGKGDAPRVVAIGGGHGLARSLGAARRFAGSVAAVVSVADDGGSSGRLRAQLEIPAPGDLRRAIGALVGEESALSRALEHRFSSGELEGHAFGNLLLAALFAGAGDFAAGVAEACRLLGTVGPVYPATLEPVVLRADARGATVRGQVAVMATAAIERVGIEPASARTPAGALAAVAAADLVVLGPGSLYTSVLAALGAPELAAALRASGARVVYVANLREQPPETSGYDVAAHVAALIAHGIRPDVVLADPAKIALGRVDSGVELVAGALAARNGLVHDEDLLAAALAALADAPRAGAQPRRRSDARARLA